MRPLIVPFVCLLASSTACTSAPSGQCDADVDCPNGLVCVDAVCRLAHDASSDIDDAGVVCVSEAECDDALACTVDECVEGACVHRPSDDRCGDGQVCERTGCVAVGCDPSACETRGCVMAECVDGECVRTDACADGAECCAGECVPAGCDDGDECTRDRCGATGCEHAPQMGSEGRPFVDGGVCSPDGGP